MKSAEIFDSDEPTLAEQSPGAQDGRETILDGGDVGVTRPQRNEWSAFGAGHSLRMEASILRIFIFSAAFVTGNIPVSGEARPATGTTDKGIEIMAVVRVEQFALTFGADGSLERSLNFQDRRFDAGWFSPRVN
jgi:hypothetical protein